ncbi:MAG: Uma2 family endonuclease [Caldilineaceae bacterium]|nr:Uma2 family endonuclease [Caldilineaceae bacterium]
MAIATTVSQERVRNGTQTVATQQTEATAPPLENGDRLTRAEFERRYQQYPQLKKAELIESEVYVGSPVHVQSHADPHFDLISWLGFYRAATPGVRGSDNATLRIDLENEPQPDILLRLDRHYGGRTYISEDDYLEGSPELIVEVAASSASYDLNKKKRIYARNGVQEYLVAQAYERRIDWFALHDSGYISRQPDDNGVIRSAVFPGLWLAAEAVWPGDLAQMLAVLQQGMASPEYAAFVEQLQQRSAS